MEVAVARVLHHNAFLNPCIAAPAPVTIATGRPLLLPSRAIALGTFPAGCLDRMATDWISRF